MFYVSLSYLICSYLILSSLILSYLILSYLPLLISLYGLVLALKLDVVFEMLYEFPRR